MLGRGRDRRCDRLAGLDSGEEAHHREAIHAAVAARRAVRVESGRLRSPGYSSLATPEGISVRLVSSQSAATLRNVALGEAFQPVLVAARMGAQWALAGLYREYNPGLLRYLQAQEPNDGEDLVSDTWLDAAAGLKRFRGDESAFRRWLFTIARRRLIDHRRRRARSAQALARSDTLGHRPEPDETEAAVLAADETEAAVARIAALPREQGEVILLRVLAGLDVADVAEIVGKKPGAVRVLQHRALQRLAEQFARDGRPVTR
jgi:RNA polymerase sigma-70 factor (ECF subfamily)